MQLVDETNEKALPCTQLTTEQMRAVTSKLGAKIVELLAERPMHSSEIARALNHQEQRIYYHTKRLRDANIISVDHLEDTSGGTAKVLRLTNPAFAVTFKKLQRWHNKQQTNPVEEEFLAPFIKKGKWNARIVVGSPLPHGPESARGRDASYAIDLALFFGLHLTNTPRQAMLLDTELTSWKQNLIIIGGPVVNKAAERVNPYAPITYDKDRKEFVSKGDSYGQENAGVIVKMPNPFAKGKWVLLITGKRYTGTQAAILSFSQEFTTLCSQMNKNGIFVVEGIDANSDGSIDSVKILS